MAIYFRMELKKYSRGTFSLLGKEPPLGRQVPTTLLLERHRASTSTQDTHILFVRHSQYFENTSYNLIESRIHWRVLVRNLSPN